MHIASFHYMVMALIGAGGGLISGAVGLAGGIFIVPALVTLLGTQAMGDAIVVSFFAVLLNSLSATIENRKSRGKDAYWVLVNGAGTALAWCASVGASEHWQQQAPDGWLRPAGCRNGSAMRAGLVVARTIAMLINEAADAVTQGVCSATDADTAMRLGVNYPAGPFEWLAAWDAREVVRLLDHLDGHYRGERYRVGLGLRQRAWQRETLPH